MRTSGLYRFLRLCAQLTLKVFFRKIYWTDASNIPRKGPVLIACNHPMAFTEACLLAAFLPRPIHFMVRGDAFVKRWLWFFKATNQIPIYRFRDGFKNLRKNADSMHSLNQVLIQGGAILIFVEGESVFKKQLGHMQRGLGRIAMDYYQSGGELITVLPVGINYDDGIKFRSDVYVNFGETFPLRINNEFTQRENINVWTKEIGAAMQKTVWHIENEYLEKANAIFMQHYYNDTFPLWPAMNYSPICSEKRRTLVKSINIGHKTQVVVKKNALATAVLSILSFPIWILGWLILIIPISLAYQLTRKNSLGIEFVTAIRLGILMVGFILIGLLFLFCSIFFWPIIFVPLMLLFIGKFSLYIYDRWKLLLYKF